MSSLLFVFFLLSPVSFNSLWLVSCFGLLWFVVCALLFRASLVCFLPLTLEHGHFGTRMIWFDMLELLLWSHILICDMFLVCDILISLLRSSISWMTAWSALITEHEWSLLCDMFFSPKTFDIYAETYLKQNPKRLISMLKLFFTSQNLKFFFSANHFIYVLSDIISSGILVTLMSMYANLLAANWYHLYHCPCLLLSLWWP